MRHKNKILVLLVLFLLQMIVMTKNWNNQMYQGNWVELIFLEFTLQSLYYCFTEGQNNKQNGKEEKEN